MLARGLRNNNPGNIRHGASWQGMAAEQLDADFVTFTAPEWGIRAIVRILHHYQALGITTVTAIISRWAPPNENNTPAYIKSICDYAALAPTDVVPDTALPAVIKGIIIHENGSCPYDYDLINKGIALAS